MILTFVKTLDDAAFCLPMLWFSDFQLKISKTPKLDLVNDQKKSKINSNLNAKNKKHMRVICEMQNKSKNISFNFKE